MHQAFEESDLIIDIERENQNALYTDDQFI